MPSTERSTDVVEQHSERAFIVGGGGLLVTIIGAILWIYRGQGSFTALAFIMLIIGGALLLYGLYCALQIRKVTSYEITCPYCSKKNSFLHAPVGDVACRECLRMVPIEAGKPLSVTQVRCGYCNELNYYSPKTFVLLCESCNHEIPVSREDGAVHHSSFAVQDDDRTYELVLVAYDHAGEELIDSLQHTLALNRTQVKQILTELPQTLLTGIPKRKAEMLAAQLSVHGASTQVNPLAR